jgi:pimeloyl-ACP methyl ester carboxylesterase
VATEGKQLSGSVETKTISVGKRDVCIELAGDPQGMPILVHAGEPMSRLLYSGWIADAETKGIRLISFDRPGYGGSTADPGHTVASGADNVRAIAEALGHDRLGIWGISGGGPYALACAALLSDLAVGVASVASIAPYGIEALDYFAGMGELNVEGTELYFSDPEAARLDLREAREGILAATPEQFADELESLLAPVDTGVLTGDLAQWLLESHKVALSASDQGWWDNGAAYLTDWGFDLHDIRVPVKIWHGRQDRFVPVQHGEWLAANVPGAEADISDRDGHLTMIGRVGDYHDWLLQHF